MNSSARVALSALLTAAALSSLGCGAALDSKLCETPGCEFSRVEWQRLESLAHLPDPPPDPSNKYVGVPAAEKLGQQFYFDPRFSGNATGLDTLRRPVQYARAAAGQPTNISCATCHNPARAGADFTSLPGHVSVGAGWYDVNAQPTVNSAYYQAIYWNGRNDSLWAQIIAVNESFVSMASNRLKNAWVINDYYRAAYNAVFTDHPLPLPEITSTALQAVLETSGSKTGQCKLVADINNPGNFICPTDAGCRIANNADGSSSCWPRFPLQGRPGSKAGCQGGDTSEPFFDAYDCMDPADARLATRVYVNFAKAIAAYEYKLVSGDSAFDHFVHLGPESDVISASAKRGARLFVGKAACIDCHNTPLFSDNDFHNIGVPQQGPGVPSEADCYAGNAVCDCSRGFNCLPWGALDGLAKLKTNGFRRDSVWSDDAQDASRKMFVDRTLGPELKGAWRTPSLRNIELTAPYMHDGLLHTLEDVVWHYNVGGAGTAGVPGTPSVRITPLDLSAQEQLDLVAFLRTLTGAPLPTELANPPTLP